MKNILLLSISLLLFFSCKKEENSFITINGQIENKHTDSLIIFHPEYEYRKVIQIENNGSFKDTLQCNEGIYVFSDGRNYTELYFKENDTLTINYDSKLFNISFEGNSFKENDFLKASIDTEDNLMYATNLIKLSENEFNTKINSFISNFKNKLSLINNESFKTNQLKKIKLFEKELTKNYKNSTKLNPGKPSPEFKNYLNYNGSKASLKDFNGKYIYIDVWATWCKPCKDEIPFLQKLENLYHNKNIEFISISIDSKQDYQIWKSMIADKKMSGTQLFANGDTNFTENYNINSIPRFILIDASGNIINANAPRPSDNKLIETLNSLDI